MFFSGRLLLRRKGRKPLRIKWQKLLWRVKGTRIFCYYGGCHVSVQKNHVEALWRGARRYFRFWIGERCAPQNRRGNRDGKKGGGEYCSDCGWWQHLAVP